MSAQLKPCGTRAAYRRHRKNGEEPCRECKSAMAAYNVMHEGGRSLIRARRCPSCKTGMRSNVGICDECKSELELGLWFGRWVGRKGTVVWVPNERDGAA